jgi:hypothetical protein
MELVDGYLTGEEITDPEDSSKRSLSRMQSPLPLHTHYLLIINFINSVAYGFAAQQRPRNVRHNDHCYASVT